MISKQTVAAGGLLLVVAVASLAYATNATNATGDRFIKEAIQGNLEEVKIGQLAQEKGSSREVKDFGAALAKDHQAANENATQAAQEMNVTPPNKPGPKQQAVYQKLSALSGEQFDHQFIKSMVKDHKEDIAKYQQEAKRSGPAADYAKQTLPKLREHLKMAEDLQRSQIAGAAQSSKMR